jgi:hypothetical protein
MTDDQIHWFSIINSLMIVLFLSGMVAMIMMRTLHRDISKCAHAHRMHVAMRTSVLLRAGPGHLHCRSSPSQHCFLRTIAHDETATADSGLCVG